ncbi:hypothetical protein D8I24_5993 [Cupriavidus necator H850]|nr:hypothetical protein D8I24_5993 [Cupriavidus necator H850]
MEGLTKEELAKLVAQMDAEELRIHPCRRRNRGFACRGANTT